MIYADQLKHPLWQKKRLQILNRDGFRCTHCDSTEKTLHVHHLEYKRFAKAWEYEDGLLISLCKDCHDELHHIERKITHLVSLVIRRDFTLGGGDGHVAIEGFVAGILNKSIGTDDCKSVRAWLLGRSFGVEQTQEALGFYEDARSWFEEATSEGE